MAKSKSKAAAKLEDYVDDIDRTRPRRMRWWRKARFGMFVHWGLYAIPGRGEWIRNRESIPADEYHLLTEQFSPKPRAAREWARLAKKAGMQYMVMTAKHHDGYCLWDTAQTDFNSVRTGPGRDLVAEYVDACREYGLKVGLYYSLMDWDHPDAVMSARDENARRRFVDFTHGCVEELCRNYGAIDILWFDVPQPLQTSEEWESLDLARMIRKRQPYCMMNNRNRLDNDYDTPEGRIVWAEPGRDWEACMTFNGAWGYVETPEDDWLSTRDVIRMIRRCTAGQGNLLLNIGPASDGSVPKQAVTRLTEVGKWLAKHGDAVYGKVDAINMLNGSWTRKHKTAYYWLPVWPGESFGISHMTGSLRKATILGTNKSLRFTQNRTGIFLSGLPATCPEKIAQFAVLKLEFASTPRRTAGPMPA